MAREYKNAQEAIAADIAGDSVVTVTSLDNGWGGSIVYEKLSNGLTLVDVNITTVGTTTDSTILTTLPAGYRPNGVKRIAILSTLGTYGAGGYLEIGINGTIRIYDFQVSITTFSTSTAAYMSRN